MFVLPAQKILSPYDRAVVVPTFRWAADNTSLNGGTSSAVADVTNANGEGSRQRVFALFSTCYGTAVGAPTGQVIRMGGWNILTRQINTVFMETSWRFFDFCFGRPDIQASGNGVAEDPTGSFIISFTGIDRMFPFDVPIVVTTGTSTNPDPGSITPVTPDCMIVVICVCDAGTITAPPSGYTEGAENGRTDVTRIEFETSYKLLSTPAAENPGVVTNGTSSNWICITMALRPARY